MSRSRRLSLVKNSQKDNVLSPADEETLTAQRYRVLLNERGISHEALNWGSRASQQLRFRILSEIAPLSGKRILDVGCGLGDFVGWLSENRIEVDYTGVDITAELVVEARKIHPGRTFRHGNILDAEAAPDQKYDYVFASGIFATYVVGADAWMDSAVSRMWSLATEGVAFNSLSSWANARDLGEYHADPLTVMTRCRKLTPWVTIRHDYHPRDFTVYLFKNGNK